MIYRLWRWSFIFHDIDNDVWKVMHNGIFKEEESLLEKIVLLEIIHQYYALAEIMLLKEKEGRSILLRHSQGTFLRRCWMDDAKEFGKHIRTGLVGLKMTLEQIDDMDIEEMDINWQIAMIAIRMKKFYKKTGRRVCEGSFGNPSEHSSESESKSISVPNEMSTSKSVTTIEKSCRMNQKEVEHMSNVNTSRSNVNSVRANVNSVRQNVNSVRTKFNMIIHLRNMEERDTLSVLGKFDGKCDEGFLVGYSLNSKSFRVYNLVTKKVEVNLHVKFLEGKPNVKGVGTSEVTNNAGTLPTPYANASEKKDEAEELIVVPTTVRPTASKVGSRKSSTNLKAEEFLTELQNLKTQEKEAYSTCILEDTPDILAFRRELDELAPKHLSEVPKNKATSTTLVNPGSGPVNTQHADQDDSDMPELTIFNKPQKGIFDEASYDNEGEIDISPQGLEAAETLVEALSQIKTKRRNVKTGVRRRLDAEDVSTGFEDVSTGFTDIKSASERLSSGGEHVSASQREGKAVLKETPQTKRTKKQIREEQASLAEIARIQAKEEAENARRE
ncbi:hypothetical protein Tco_0716610 [Tanacetum coccineum]